MSWARAFSKYLFATADAALRRPPGPRILIYHRVGESPEDQIEVLTRDFEQQLDWLKANRTIVDLETALRRWDEPGADQLAVVTFDDGFESTYTKAFPTLSRLEIPFTLYVTTGFVAGDQVLGGASGREALTWSMIKEMESTGLLTVGSHTHTHIDVRESSPDTLREELAKTDEIIGTEVGVEVKHFAYPWGYWSDIADPIVRDRYASAALGSRRPGSSRNFDPLKLFRVPILSSDGTRWFQTRLGRGLQTEEAARRAIRRYRGP